MSLIQCLGKLSGGKNGVAVALEDRQELHRLVAENQKNGMSRDTAERDAVSTLLSEAQANHDYIKGEIEKEGLASPTKTKQVKAPDEPDNMATSAAPSGAPKVLASDIQNKTWKEKAIEIFGSGERNPLDFAANALLGKSHSLLGKMSRAGENGAYSKVNPGRASAEAANAQGNNSIGIVSRAMEIGHMVIDKMGRVKSVEDKENNIHTMNKHYKALRSALEKLGYKEKADAKDPNTVTNAVAYALFGPRLEELVKIDQFDKDYYGPAEKALSDKLRADPTLRPHIDAFQNTYNKMRGHALDALVESGTFTPEKAKEFMDRSEYLPLYRIDEQLKNNLGEPIHINSLLATAKEHHLGYGSDLSIGDPIVNAFNNLTWLNTRAVKNNTANILAESLVAVGGAKWKKTQGTPGDKHTMQIMVKGEPKFLRVEDLNDASAFTAAPVVTGLGWNMARMFSNAVRKGVTLMPGFVWGQTSQDAQRVAIMTGEGYGKSYANVTQGFWKNFNGETKEADILRAYGVAGARDYVDSFDNFRKDMLDRQDSKWWHFVEKAERMATSSDLAAREAAYKKRIAEGADEFAAQHAARMLIDFNNRGNSRTLAALMTLTPFVNARIQGTHRMVDALRGKIPGMGKEEAQKMALMQVGKLMAFTLAYSLYKKDDDEYENQTTIVRNNNFMLGPFRVPVAGEMLPFKVLAETTARQMMDAPGEDWSKSRGSMAGALGNVLLGPSDMVPSLVRPVVEAATNHSFATGHELISKGLANASPKNQYTNSNTAASKAIAAGIQDTLDAMGIHESGVSPIVLENFITGWTGRAGQEALNIMRNLESGFGDRAAPKRSEVALVGAFTTNPEGNALRGDFQEVVDRVNAARADLKRLQDAGKGKEAAEFIREHQKVLALQARITPIQQRLAAIKKREQMMEKTGENRAALYQQKLQALQQVHEIRKQAGF